MHSINRVQTEVPDERVRIIIVGESVMMDTGATIETIEECANDPNAADYDESDLGELLGKAFDGSHNRHSEEKIQTCIIPTACCLIGKCVKREGLTLTGGKTVVVALFRKDDGYAGAVLPGTLPKDMKPVDIMMSGFAKHLDKLEAVGFDADSNYHKAAARLRGPRTMH